MPRTMLRTMLVHRCDVLRQASGAASGHGHNTGAWSASSSGVRCRFMENAGRDLEEPMEVNVKTWRVFFEHGTDVVFGDRLSRDGIEYEVIDVVGDVAGAAEMMRVTVERVGV